MKLCKDCKWVSQERIFWIFPNWDRARCNRLLKTPHPVTGKEQPRDVACLVERASYYGQSGCGPDAVFFEPRKGGSDD